MIEIKEATLDDYPRVLELIKELAVYEKEPDAVEITLDELITNGTGEQPLFKCFVGFYSGKIEGIALCYPRFSTWKGKTIHLEDLIVTQQMRGLGLGKALYKAVMVYAHAQKVRRVEWVVLDWNESAIEFYKHTGATILEDWNLAQMDEQALHNYIYNEDI
ncbi:GNAT family N-acetyltransferase [Nonlabens sp.]|uniref:GNAT family N-acetyltransferase n=1 Tax=Nonlabens sp. TaxID=1888209 RepID=UPI003F69BE8F